MTNQTSINGFGHPTPHFVLVPLMAQGHMIPMVDMARLLADRGALVSYITTPVNAARIKPTIESCRLPIRLVELPFPTAEVGLPEGCENVDLIHSGEHMMPFFEATRLLADPMELYLRQQPQGPTCIISDWCNSWTAEVARKLGVPRIIFHGPSSFYLLCVYNIRKNGIYDRITDPFEPFVVPDLPHEGSVVVTTAQALGFLDIPGWEKLRDEALEAEATADGLVLNSFDGLEHSFIESYAKAMGSKIWAIGPMSLHNKDTSYKATRGNKAVVDQHRVLTWLDSKSTGSVIYVSFGSLARNDKSQMIEIGLGLEASDCPFIWVVKEVEKSPEVDKWLSGFEERTMERGLVIKGWAPQVVILSHPAVGGFVTHCGWNSMLEAVCAGVPVMTWPHFADQFLNEKLMVEVLRIGVSIGAKIPSYPLQSKEGGEMRLVQREDVEKAVVSLMEEGEEGKERRERAKVFGVKAKEAMEEGGSSYRSLTHLIQYVMER
nr:UDP-glycosyltransferase [Paris polyphylla]